MVEVFMISQHGENKLKQFIDKLKKFHPTIKFTCDILEKEFTF